MKRDQLAQWRAADEANLERRTDEVQLALDRCRVAAGLSQVKNHHQQRALRRELAQLKTLANEPKYSPSAQETR